MARQGDGHVAFFFCLAKANYSNAMDAHNSAFYAFQMFFGGSREAG
jgi:hypothetical protein